MVGKFKIFLCSIYVMKFATEEELRANFLNINPGSLTNLVDVNGTWVE